MSDGSIAAYTDLSSESDLLWPLALRGGRRTELFYQERMADGDKQRLDLLERHFFVALLGGVSVMAWSFVWAMLA